MKSYTDLEQSRKLAKILPLESADMVLWGKDFKYVYADIHAQEFIKGLEDRKMNYVPCWSLAVLINMIPNYKLSSEHNYHTCTAETSFGKETVAWFDNPVDACYEMIIKLHELNLL